MGSKKYILSEMQWVNENYFWNFQSARKELTPACIKNRKWLAAVSLRNPSFSNRWIEAVLHSATKLQGQTDITLVDSPYVSSVAALSKSKKEFEKNIAKMQKQRNEQWHRLNKKINSFSNNISFISWQHLCDITPSFLSNELNSAYENPMSRVRFLIRKQVHRVFPDVDNQNLLDQLAKFFIEEAPVLINYYYSFSPGCVDVYPGPQAQFFWELDLGLLSNELPGASKISSESEPHVYCYSGSTN